MKIVYNLNTIKPTDKLYCKVDKKEDECVYYYIFKMLEAILKDDYIIINTSACYTFMVPNNKNRQAFLYDNYSQIKIKKTDSLYKMSESEYLDTYLAFMKNDNKLVNDLPSKLIQDVV